MQLHSLFKTFNPGTPIENPALQGINLDIAAGEFVTVIGSNGSGKSTMLNAISGDLLVDSGEIIIDGRNMTRLNTWQRAGAVARVFQDPITNTINSLNEHLRAVCKSCFLFILLERSMQALKNRCAAKPNKAEKSVWVFSAVKALIPSAP